MGFGDPSRGAKACPTIVRCPTARGIVNRLIRDLGPISAIPPAFPWASSGTAPLRAKSESIGSPDFAVLWCGQAVRLARRGLSAGELTRTLAAEALARING